MATEVKPVDADKMALKIIRRASRVIGLYTVAVAAFMFMFAGVLTLFELHDATLNPFPPVIIDLGLFFFGVFIGVEVIGRMAGAFHKVNHPNK